MLLFASSCIRELPDGQSPASGNEIRFTPDSYDIELTKSDEGSGAKKVKRAFIGMMDRDSLYVNISESSMNAVQTKASGSPNIPDFFYLTAYHVHDEMTDKYIDELKLEKGTDWSDYSPKTYWPQKYTGIHFFAHTHSTENKIVTPSYNIDGEFSTTFEYIVPKSDSEDLGDGDVQPDLTFAIAPSLVQSQNPVKLNFVHALSAVRFQLGELGDGSAGDNARLFATVTGVISNRKCTITYTDDDTDTGLTVVWEDLESVQKESYTQEFTGDDAFMMIPQELTEATAIVNIQVGSMTHEYEFPLTDSWKHNKMYTYTITAEGYVETTVDDIKNIPNSETIYEFPSIQNTGWTTSHIRAAIIGYWSKTEDVEINDGNGGTTTATIEKIVGPWDINNTADATVTPTTFNIGTGATQWTLGRDGFYYYNSPLAPAEMATPLFNRFEQKSTSTVSDSKLKLNIVVQAVEDKSVWTSSGLN